MNRGVMDWFGAFLIDRGFLSPSVLRDVLRMINGSVWQCQKCRAGHLVLLDHDLQRCSQCDGDLGPVAKRDSPKSKRRDRLTASILRMANPNRFDPGEMVGSYEIVEVLGEGGMAIVYRARDTLLERELALKIYYTQGRNAIKDRERFHLESQLAGRLEHQNIVRIHDWGSEGEIHYFAMDLVEGQNLKEIVDVSSLPPKQALRHAAEVADGVHYAHEQGVIHRDLKPANVIIGPDGIARVLDFGLACIHDEGGNPMIDENHPVGTPRYMAPEQLSTAGAQADARTDVYGIGTILYEMLTAQRVFTFKSRKDLFDTLRYKMPTAPREIDPDIPKKVEAICMKALAKDPAERFQTASEMAQAIRDLLLPPRRSRRLRRR